MSNVLDPLTKRIPVIPEDVGYWFVRTAGGALHQAFIASESIAVGYSRIGLGEVLAAAKSDAPDAALKQIVKRKYPDKKSPGLAVSQLLAIASGIKKGDYVLIPSAGTARIAIGQVQDSMPFEKTLVSGEHTYEDYSKRRRVKWIANYARSEINPNVWKILNTHQTIVDAAEYSQWIDPLIFDFFKKGENYHLSIRINRKEHINGRVLFEACLQMFEAADRFSSSHGLVGSSDQIEVKINLNSPGKIQLIAKTAKVLGVLSLVVLLLNGGGLKFTVKGLGIDMDINTPGVIQAVNTFLNDQQNRELKESLQAKIDALKVDDSAQIESLLAQIQADHKRE